jgi:hypothetical protein
MAGTYEPFRNRVATDVVPVAQRDPAALNSGIGQDLAALGNAIGNAAQTGQEVEQRITASNQRIAMEQKRRDQSARIATLAGQWADVQVQLDQKRDDLRNSTGGDEYSAKAGQLTTDTLTSFLDPLKNDPDVYERYAPLVADYGARTRMADQDWAKKQQATAEGQGIDKWATVTGNRLISEPTPDNYVAAINGATALVGGMDMPEAVRGKTLQTLKGGFATNFLDGRLASGDWQGARTLLDKGMFDGVLDPDAKARYLQRTQVVEDAQASRARAAANEAKSQALEGIRTVEAKIAGGIVPDPKELDTTEAAAKAAGVDPSDMVKFGVLRVQSQVNHDYGGLVGTVGGADRLRNARDALAAQIAAGKANEADQVRKAQLDKLVDSADDKEVGVLKELANKGTPGALAALSQITGNKEARYDKAEKIAPGLGPIAMLGPVSQRQALEGREVRKARPKDFGTQVQVETSAKAMLGSNILSVLGGNYGTVRDTAWAIMAGRRAASGKEGYDEADYRSALNAAMGATRRQSDGKLAGGIQTVMGKSVWAPTWQTGEDMVRSLRNSNFGGAVYANGKPAARDDILANYTPVYVRDDPSGNPIYQFFDANGGYLARADKQPFVLRFTKTR